MGFDSLNFIESRIILNQIHDNPQPRFRAKANSKKRRDATNTATFPSKIDWVFPFSVELRSPPPACRALSPDLREVGAKAVEKIFILGYTEKTFNTEAQSARRKEKARFGEKFLCELLLFSPCPPCLRGKITFFQWSHSCLAKRRQAANKLSPTSRRP